MRGRRHKLQVSTFPFLAVLLCAMGSLILVLLVMDRKAHKAAQARAQQQAARLVEESARNETARQAEIEQRKEQVRKEWEQKRDALHDKLSREQIELQLQMRKVREELQGIAARLHYEQDTSTQLRRKVQDENSRLRAEELLLRSLRSNAKQTENQSQESSQALRRMTIDLLQMEQVLKDLKTAKQREQKTFSVVPYHGRRGENRRPLYVECTGQGVIFHPERKAMPMTALIPRSEDSACEVRTEVEQRIARQRQKLAGLPGTVDKMPYLLLLLRPSGVTSYHLLQRALRGLPLDFGYEFIDDDWVLDFPVDDELPSTQPWMIAAKTPSRPAAPPAPVPTAAPPSRTNPRPIAGAPMSNSGVAFPSITRGFRGGESGGYGSWVTGDRNQSGSPRGTGGGPGGTGAGMSGDGPSGPQAPLGSGGNGSDPRAVASGGSSTLADTHGRNLPSRGYGHGHPSAMPPRFSNDQEGVAYSGEGGGPGGGFPAVGSLFARGSNTGSRPGPGLPGDGTPGAGGSDLPGLGPPSALTSGPGEGNSGGSTGQSGVAGTSRINNGISGNGGGGAGTAGSGNPGFAPGMGTSADGRYVVARGNNGGDAPGWGVNGSGSGTGIGGAAQPGTFGGGGPSSTMSNNYGPNFGGQGSAGSPSGTPENAAGSHGGQAVAGAMIPGVSGGAGAPGGTQVPGSQVPPGNGRNGPNPISQGAGSPSQPTAGSSTGGATAIGGVSGGQSAAGAAMQGNGGRSSEVVIFVDPLTGQRTSPPPQAPADNGPGEGSPPEQTDGNKGPPRIRVMPVTSAAGGGQPSSGDAQSQAMDRYAPAPSFAPPPRRVSAPRPVWVHGGRDWTIYVECRAGDLVLYPSQQSFTLAQAVSDTSSNPLIKAIQKMVDRRQSSRRPGEPPFHPQVCLLVRPEHIRTYLTVYPALEALPVPKTRRNLDADDDVISIVTGAVP